MIYRSNLKAPDLQPGFKMLSRPWHDSLGHDAPADPDFDPNCGWLTHDEAAILFNVAAASFRRPGAFAWLDIGCRTGWTTAHLAAAGAWVAAVDPELAQPGFRARFDENLAGVNDQIGASSGIFSAPTKSALFFENFAVRDNWNFDGAMIDGDHDSPAPVRDAAGALAMLKPTGVIVFHDALGKPIRDAIRFLVHVHGFRARAYWTPRVMVVCYRGDFVPPEHDPDLAVRAVVSAHFQGSWKRETGQLWEQKNGQF